MCIHIDNQQEKIGEGTHERFILNKEVFTLSSLKNAEICEKGSREIKIINSIFARRYFITIYVYYNF